MYGSYDIFYFERKKTFMQYFYCFLVGAKFIFSVAYFLTVFWKGISEFFGHKLLHLRYCKGPKSSSVSTNMDCILQVPKR